MIDRTNGPHGTQEFRLTPQSILGLFVIAAGVLFTLDNLGILYADEYIRFWPVALIAVGALKLAHSHRGSGAVAGFILLFTGIWQLLEEVTTFRVHLEDIWPLLLVFFGGYLVWQGLSTQRASPRVGQTGNDTLSGMAILGAFVRGSNSQAFRGADLTAIMGGCEIDLRHAAINGEATIDVFALWGGIEIRVPDDWTIESRATPLLGAVEDKTRPPKGTSNHRLILRGFVIMGGVEIKN
jgi:predicted membrane protein